MWLLYLTNGFQSSVLYSLTPYAASDFESHSLLPVIDIVSSAMTASVYIPLAKILDLWGRAEGFLLMVIFATLGMILLAGSQNLATYCAATVRVSRRKLTHDDANLNSGVLATWLVRPYLQHRCYYSGLHEPEEPRSGLRLHFVSLHHHRFRWTEVR